MPLRPCITCSFYWIDTRLQVLLSTLPSGYRVPPLRRSWSLMTPLAGNNTGRGLSQPDEHMADEDSVCCLAVARKANYPQARPNERVGSLDPESPGSSAKPPIPKGPFFSPGWGGGSVLLLSQS
jgi:hypothetical protein